MKDSTMRYYDTKTGRELTVENGGLIPATSGRGPSESAAPSGALALAPGWASFMANIPYDDWRAKAAREIADALRDENQRVAYYAAGLGDGWARSYGAGNFRSPDYAAIIDRHFQASLSKPNVGSQPRAKRKKET